MAAPFRWFAKICLNPAMFSLIVIARMSGQAPAAPESRPEFAFWAVPESQLLAQGAPVTLKVSIYNASGHAIFVSRLNRDELLNFKVIGPDGKSLLWQRKAPMVLRPYVSSDFATLEPYHEISAQKVISLQDGTGFDFGKPGQYSLTTEYSPAPREQLEHFAVNTIIPTGSSRSAKAAFCIEVCVVGPVPGPIQVRSDATLAALETVRVFYNAIVKYHPLGIPHPKKAFWPLLSNRLTAEFDSVQACNTDYYRRYGKILRANHYKPAIIWLEDGPLTGPNEAATPASFSILGSRAIGENRVDVHLKFASQSERPDDSFDYEGVLTVIRENDRWLIDDFVPMYENEDLARLSDDISECKGGKWVGPHY